MTAIPSPTSTRTRSSARSPSIPPSPTSSTGVTRSTSSTRPGYGIYTTDAIQGLRVADAALVLISAVAGIEVQTEKMWKAAAGFELPVLFGVNLMDRDRASFSRSRREPAEEVRARSHAAAASDRRQKRAFRGVVDLVSGKALTWGDDESGKLSEVDVPAELADEVSAAREALMEMVAEQDEELDGEVPRGR